MGGASSKTKPPQRTTPVPALDGFLPAAAGDASGGEEDRRGADNADNADNTGGDATAPTKLTAEEAQAKATLLPEGKPPKEVTRWFMLTPANAQETLDDEKEHKRALAWLKAALLLAHKDADTKQWIKRLLAVEYFTANMTYMGCLLYTSPSPRDS